jgi:hypothetical protein
MDRISKSWTEHELDMMGTRTLSMMGHEDVQVLYDCRQYSNGQYSYSVQCRHGVHDWPHAMVFIINGDGTFIDVYRTCMQ